MSSSEDVFLRDVDLFLIRMKDTYPSPRLFLVFSFAAVVSAAGRRRRWLLFLAGRKFFLVALNTFSCSLTDTSWICLGFSNTVCFVFLFRLLSTLQHVSTVFRKYSIHNLTERPAVFLFPLFAAVTAVDP